MREVPARPTSDGATRPSGTGLSATGASATGPFRADLPPQAPPSNDSSGTGPSATGLVNAARSGDADARAALFSEYLPLIYNVVGRGLHGHADVDDVVQETMLRAMRALPELRDPERFRSWIVAIAVRQMHDHRRRNKAVLARHTQVADAAEVPDPAGDFAERAVDRQTLSRAGSDLLEASQWLSDEQRRTLALWWQGRRSADPRRGGRGAAPERPAHRGTHPADEGQARRCGRCARRLAGPAAVRRTRHPRGRAPGSCPRGAC